MAARWRGNPPKNTIHADFIHRDIAERRRCCETFTCDQTHPMGYYPRVAPLGRVPLQSVYNPMFPCNKDLQLSFVSLWTLFATEYFNTLSALLARLEKKISTEIPHAFMQGRRRTTTFNALRWFQNWTTTSFACITQKKEVLFSCATTLENNDKKDNLVSIYCCYLLWHNCLSFCSSSLSRCSRPRSKTNL
jgi:hypothetical protein